MKKIFILLLLIAVSCKAQNKKEADFKEFISYFKKEIKTPIDFKSPTEINVNDTLPKTLYNDVVIHNQSKRAKRYGVGKNDTLIEIDDYGEQSSGVSIVNSKAFHKRIHPLGYINLDKNYKCFIIEIRQVANVFIDIYVFDFNGNITSFLELYEESSFIIDYNKREPRDDEYERIIESNIEKNGIIKRFLRNNGVSLWTDWQLQPDGYFKPIKYKKEGKNWWADE